jgi:hypothetical protein
MIYKTRPLFVYAHLLLLVFVMGLGDITEREREK